MLVADDETSARFLKRLHQRLDGTGYPDGLRNGDVPLLAQIIGTSTCSTH